MVSANPPSISDDVLRAARRGDDSALHLIWNACQPVLDDVVRRCHPASSAEADDLVQEAAIAVLSFIQQGEADHSSTTCSETYAVQTALERAIRWRLYNYVRRERKRGRRLLSTDEQSLERALAHSGARAGVPSPLPGRRVARALETLSPRQRAVVNGLYFRDQSVATLSRELQVTPQAVTALHRRALATLRNALGMTEPSATPANDAARQN